MSAPGPPPGWSPQGHPGASFPPGPPGFPSPPGPPVGGPFPGARPPRRSGPSAALVVLVVLVLVLAGGAAYLATISSGRYPKLIWACVLLPPDQAQVLVPHGLPEGGAPKSGDHDSSCRWGNIVAENVGLEKQGAFLTVRVTRYGRGLLTSAEDSAHKWLLFTASGSGVKAAGTGISGYGDEAYRMPKAFGGEFDSIVFRDSNLVVEVAAEVDDHPGSQAELAWSRTQRAAALVGQRLRTLRR
jgi:hypothetical protein